MNSYGNPVVVEAERDLHEPPSKRSTPSVAAPEIFVNHARKSDRFDALVTQGWGRLAYNIVRSLARRGLKVVLGTDEFLGMAVLSRYTSATFLHPAYIRHTHEF